MTIAPALEAVDVTRTYELEGVVVEALRGVSLAVAARRVRRGGRAVRVGQVDAHAPVRLPGPADLGESCASTAATSTSLDDTELAELRNAAIGFVFQSFQLLLADERRRQRGPAPGLPGRRTPGAP